MKPDGGPAFPQEREFGDRFTGMTLRDYFAAAALPAIIEAYIEAHGRCIGTDHFVSNVPTHAYRMSDALLAERDK